MTAYHIPAATHRFSLSIDGLLKAVAARIAWGMEAAMILLIWTRIKRIETRVLALIAAIRAGRLRGGWVIGARAARAAAAPRVAPARPRVPRRSGWLLELVPYEAACFAEQLRRVLAEPEMVVLLAATPRMGQLLRPLCRMLGIEAELVSPVAAAVEVVVPGVSVLPVRDLGAPGGAEVVGVGPQREGEPRGGMFFGAV